MISGCSGRPKPSGYGYSGGPHTTWRRVVRPYTTSDLCAFGACQHSAGRCAERNCEVLDTLKAAIRAEVYGSSVCAPSLFPRLHWWSRAAKWTLLVSLVSRFLFVHILGLACLLAGCLDECTLLAQSKLILVVEMIPLKDLLLDLLVHMFATRGLDSVSVGFLAQDCCNSSSVPRAIRFRLFWGRSRFDRWINLA